MSESVTAQPRSSQAFAGNGNGDGNGASLSAFDDGDVALVHDLLTKATIPGGLAPRVARLLGVLEHEVEARGLAQREPADAN